MQEFAPDGFLGRPPGHAIRYGTMIEQDAIALLDRAPLVPALDSDVNDLDAEAACLRGQRSAPRQSTEWCCGADSTGTRRQRTGLHRERLGSVFDVHPITMASMDAKPCWSEA